MLIVVDSLTGQGQRFAKKVGHPYVDIQDYVESNEDVLLLTRSFNFGEVTNEAKAFLKDHHKKVVGVAVSGNKNWGTNFGAAGIKISRKLGVDLVLKYEGSGFEDDVKVVQAWLEGKGK